MGRLPSFCCMVIMIMMVITATLALPIESSPGSSIESSLESSPGSSSAANEHDPHYDNPLNIVAVLGATAPPHFRLQAWFHSTHGLVLLNTQVVQSAAAAAAAQWMNKTALWPAAFDAAFGAQLQQRRMVVLGHDAAWPAFDDNGDLYFERSYSRDGVAVESTEEWFLPYKHRVPRPVSVGDEGVPQVVNERRQLRIVPTDETEVNSAAIKITVDPGHGGSDPGAVAQGYEEEFFNRDVALRFRDLLLGDSGRWAVQMTRTTDVDVSLSARVNMANNWPADRFISIHTNSYSSSSAQGTETYSYAEGGTAAKLRDLIQSEMIKAWGLTNRGSKTGDLYVLRETTMPATLSEMGFITSPVDIKKLSDATSRQQMAAAHLYALRRHYGYSTEDLEVDEE